MHEEDSPTRENGKTFGLKLCMGCEQEVYFKVFQLNLKVNFSDFFLNDPATVAHSIQELLKIDHGLWT